MVTFSAGRLERNLRRPEKTLQDEAPGGVHAFIPYHFFVLAQPSGYLREHSRQRELSAAKREQMEDHGVHVTFELHTLAEAAFGSIDRPAGFRGLEALGKSELRPA